MTAAELQAAWLRRGYELSSDEAEALAARIERQGIAGLYALCLNSAGRQK